MNKRLNPRKIIYNGDCTIVFWADGTKTIVKRKKGTIDDRYAVFCAALAKKMYGTNSNLKRVIKIAENTKRIKEDKPTTHKSFFDSSSLTNEFLSRQRKCEKFHKNLTLACLMDL